MLVGATFVAPKLERGDPWVSIYVAFVSFVAVFILILDWTAHRTRK